MRARSALLLVGPALGALACAATWAGVRRQRSALAADTERLIRAGASPRARPSTSADVSGAERISAGSEAFAELPPPVARYLRLAIPRPIQIEEVRIRQTGTLRTDARSERWMPFAADHLVVPPATGFLWNARVQIAPLLHVRVRDTLLDGRGSGQVSAMSAFTVSAAGGSLEMNSGSLHRYLAEAVWYPTALLPSTNLRWNAIDDDRALATLTAHGVTVSLEFRFATGGEVAGIYTPGRWGTFPGGVRQVPWEGHFRDYREQHGLLVPTEGDVGWYLDGEWHAVWKGTVIGYDVRTAG